MRLQGRHGWALPRFWVSIHSYKKLVKNIGPCLAQIRRGARVLCTASQVIGGDFARFCGLLKIRELYLASAVQSERRF